MLILRTPVNGLPTNESCIHVSRGPHFVFLRAFRPLVTAYRSYVRAFDLVEIKNLLLLELLEEGHRSVYPAFGPPRTYPIAGYHTAE